MSHCCDIKAWFLLTVELQTDGEGKGEPHKGTRVLIYYKYDGKSTFGYSDKINEQLLSASYALGTVLIVFQEGDKEEAINFTEGGLTLADLANNNTSFPVKFEFPINNKCVLSMSHAILELTLKHRSSFTWTYTKTSLIVYLKFKPDWES